MIKSFESFNPEEEWEDSQGDDIFMADDLYKKEFKCIRDYELFHIKKGHIYKIDKVYGNPEKSLRDGEEYMSIEYVEYVEVEGTIFKYYNKNTRLPYFYDYFEIMKNLKTYESFEPEEEWIEEEDIEIGDIFEIDPKDWNSFVNFLKRNGIEIWNSGNNISQPYYNELYKGKYNILILNSKRIYTLSAQLHRDYDVVNVETFFDGYRIDINYKIDKSEIKRFIPLNESFEPEFEPELEWEEETDIEVGKIYLVSKDKWDKFKTSLLKMGCYKFDLDRYDHSHTIPLISYEPPFFLDDNRFSTYIQYKDTQYESLVCYISLSHYSDEVYESFESEEEWDEWFEGIGNIKATLRLYKKQ